MEEENVSVLCLEQLGSGLVQNHHDHADQNGAGQHVGSVVKQAVVGGVHSFGSPGTVEQVAGQEAAAEPEGAGHNAAGDQTGQLIRKGVHKETGQSQNGEGQNVVQQDAADLAEQGGAVKHVAEAQDHLKNAVYKAGEAAPLYAMAVAHEDNGKHLQSYAAAHGHIHELDVAENGGEGNDQCAFDQNTGFAGGFHLGFLLVF